MNMVRVTRRVRSLAAIGVCFALAVLVGCGGGGGNKIPLKGKVTYKGAPVTGGTITLYPASGASFQITIKPDGSFETGDAPIGPMKVTIDTNSVSTAAMPGMSAGGPAPKDVKMPEMDTSKNPKKVPIPAKYAKEDTSDLKWDTKAETTKNFELTD